jgi:hypothetical protein
MNAEVGGQLKNPAKPSEESGNCGEAKQEAGNFQQTPECKE